ncbi:unnamed protein product [Brassica oleracea var. botrytis]
MFLLDLRSKPCLLRSLKPIPVESFEFCNYEHLMDCRPPFPQCNLQNTFLLLPRKCFVDLTLVAPPLLPSMAVYRKLS